MVIWTIAVEIFMVLRFAPDFEVIERNSSWENLDFGYYLYLGLQAGLFLGIVYGLVDAFLDKNWLRKRSYGSILVIKGIIHFVIIIAMSILVRIEAFAALDIEITRESLRSSLFNLNLLIVLGYTTLVSFLLNFARQINLKFGPGNLLKFITGKFHHPKEEERIFMFLDMRSSTTIAEKLGHVKFGELVQDCFSDLSVVRNREAEVYQYVGDEVILYWEVDKGIRNYNCVLAFYDYMAALKNRQDYYLKKYGVCPEFKAGLHIGEVTVTEVGDIKRDLAFLGDTMNTAARIQDQCNAYQSDVLISETLHQNLATGNGLERKFVDNITLRGKQQTIGMYSVEVSD